MAPLVWLVTGCSSGLGLELVKSILARGDIVIATARNSAKLQNLESAGASLLELDITASQEQLNTVVTKAIAIHGRIDVLVNNAGYNESGSLEDVPHHRWVAQFNTNVFGTVDVTRAVLPHMRQRKSGTVVFISSSAGWNGTAFVGPYCSSKFALEGLVESFRGEVAPLGIKTLLVDPGAFRTELLSAENIKPTETTIPEYKIPVGALFEALSAFSGNQPGDPKKAVEVIVDVVKGEGKAANRGIPDRLPLGKDAVEVIRKKCTETLALLESWEDISSSTDY